MEMANASLSHEEVSQLVDQMFISSGLERSSSLKFRDFARVVNDKMDMLWDVCLDWKGTLPTPTCDRNNVRVLCVRYLEKNNVPFVYGRTLPDTQQIF